MRDEELAPGVNARDTAEIETPARSATCCAVTFLDLAAFFCFGTDESHLIGQGYRIALLRFVVSKQHCQLSGYRR